MSSYDITKPPPLGCHRTSWLVVEHIGQVDIRVNEDAPTYPTNAVDTSLVPVGLTPLGTDRGDLVSSDPRPASEGGCSAGHLEGCVIYNIKVKHPTMFCRSRS